MHVWNGGVKVYTLKFQMSELQEAIQWTVLTTIVEWLCETPVVEYVVQSMVVLYMCCMRRALRQEASNKPFYAWFWSQVVWSEYMLKLNFSCGLELVTKCLIGDKIMSED